MTFENHGSKNSISKTSADRAFRNFKPSYLGMAKIFSLPVFPIDLFVKRACITVKILYKYSGLL